ncbi:universal stress protein [Mycobacterium malmoense]|uniref:Universal stress protein n=1 Tax=Mycobacterium malmoense TaxID=1780 RepID=A0A1B9CM22_MYCMA|nr:universal stress protein [Mycobacterium malmoense]OCB22673.1 universal stress protein [Mycobacterium malmoense]OCB32414.1 universal stress protein [Mycobacterium malmoense]OCB43321.1 universal stress protein [Mycobacterium malmoense]
MNNPQSSQRIVVGIDGSDAAINAARWAATEAVSRNVPLRLIHAIPERRTGEAGDDSLDIEYAQSSLRAADAALQATGMPVKVECDVVRGSSEGALIDESRDAAMVCVGSVGTGWVARKVLGSTADTLAQRAHCPVAIIRSSRDAAGQDGGYVAVTVGESATNDAVLEHGFREARLREAPILALGVWRWGLGEIPYRQLEHRLGPWVSRHREVHVQPAAARRGAAEFLTHTQEPVQLAVVGSEDADKVARMVGPITTHPGGHKGCSVLVVRDQGHQGGQGD